MSLALPLALALAACGGSGGDADGERKTAAGEVLGGTISDDMLPLDTVTSQNPPLRETAERGDPAVPSTKGEDEETGAAAPEPAPEPAEAPAAEAPAAETDG